jgi:hypothetical protein
MSIVSKDDNTLKTFFLAQLVKDHSFRYRLYMTKETSQEKIEIIKELVRKTVIFGSGDEAYLNLEQDIMNVNLHV